ncbi:MAG: GNAT family N-acetyltransferase [Actinomycetota bacterium]|nr:GNAT family N-acetyltransferase [Actinomycetota bacterium]
MAIEVTFSEDPEWVLTEAEVFLASEPVLHNLILVLLGERLAYPEPGRYWLAKDGETVVGVVFQSPLDFAATLTPMGPEAAAGMVDAIVETDVALPGVIGEAATAARFAGQWTERHGSAAFPVEGQRIYEMARVPERVEVGGRLRNASLHDRDLIVAWMRGFYADVGQEARGHEPVVERRLAAGQFWLWEDGEPVSMAANSNPVEGVLRVQAVYTPPDRRNRGYAGACVGNLSRRMRDEGYRCILYTDLGNPTSNLVYRRIGYNAVAEALWYRFE